MESLDFNYTSECYIKGKKWIVRARQTKNFKGTIKGYHKLLILNSLKTMESSKNHADDDKVSLARVQNKKYM